jgi:predicted nuclease of predicted toxin-antitoxin system
VIRFHLDESVQVALATALRQRGIDVTTAADAGLVSASDEEQLRFALANDRVVVSYDSDFLHLHQAGSPHAGIVYCVPGRHEVGYLVRILCLLHDCLSSEEMRGRVEFI